MSKKKWAAVALLTSLVVGGGVWGGFKLLKKDWPDRQQELAAAISEKFVQGGAPSQEVANKAAACLAEQLVQAAVAVECSAEGESVLSAIEACMTAHQEVVLTFTMALPGCVMKAFE